MNAEELRKFDIKMNKQARRQIVAQAKYEGRKSMEKDVLELIGVWSENINKKRRILFQDIRKLNQKIKLLNEKTKNKRK